jgi:hypothetical protein
MWESKNDHSLASERSTICRVQVGLSAQMSSLRHTLPPSRTHISNSHPLSRWHPILRINDDDVQPPFLDVNEQLSLPLMDEEIWSYQQRATCQEQLLTYADGIAFGRADLRRSTTGWTSREDVGVVRAGMVEWDEIGCESVLDGVRQWWSRRLLG